MVSWDFLFEERHLFADTEALAVTSGGLTEQSAQSSALSVSDADSAVLTTGNAGSDSRNSARTSLTGSDACAGTTSRVHEAGESTKSTNCNN